MTKASMKKLMNISELDDTEERERWRLNWLSSIFLFASTNIQKMGWIEGDKANWPNNEPLVIDYTETMCGYFDDIGLNKGYTQYLEWNYITKDELKYINTFHKLADVYEEPNMEPEVILKDPNWIEVVESAIELWTYLKASTTSVVEIESMERWEKDFGRIGI